MRRDQLEHAIRTACQIIHLCVAKLTAFREKDRNFVAALLEADLVDAALIASRLTTIPSRYVAATEQALTWLNSLR